MKFLISIFITIILVSSIFINSYGLSIKKINPLKLHIDSIIVDGHNDTMMTILDENTWLPLIDIGKDTKNQIDIPKLRKGNLQIPFFAAYTSAYYGNPSKAISRTLALLNALYWTMENNMDTFMITSTFEDIESAFLEKKIAAVPTMEGAYSLVKENAIPLLHQYYDLGIKAIGFTWNYSNELGEGAYKAYADKDGTPSTGGLTELGIEIVMEMNKLGMIVDVSHLAENTFWDVINTSKAPVIASHSGVYAIKSHQRNLNDKQLKALADNGGVIGIVLYPEFLTDKEETYIKDFVDHIDYAVKIMGVDHVGIGSDFDGATMPKDLKDSSEIYKITEELVVRGYNEADIQKILGRNFLRVIKEVERYKEIEEKSQDMIINPLFKMGEVMDSKTPLLEAKIQGQNIDINSFKIIINGIQQDVNYDEKEGILSYKFSSPLKEKFYAITFEGRDIKGHIARQTRIIYNK